MFSVVNTLVSIVFGIFNCALSDEFSINMRNSNFLYENGVILNSSKSNFDEKYAYIFQYKLKGYNPRKNPIYVRDENGRIFELSNHPNQSIDWKNYTETLVTPCVYLPDLRYKNVPEEEIQKLISSSGAYSLFLEL